MPCSSDNSYMFTIKLLSKIHCLCTHNTHKLASVTAPLVSNQQSKINTKTSVWGFGCCCLLQWLIRQTRGSLLGVLSEYVGGHRGNRCKGCLRGRVSLLWPNRWHRLAQEEMAWLTCSFPVCQSWFISVTHSSVQNWITWTHFANTGPSLRDDILFPGLKSL